MGYSNLKKKHVVCARSGVGVSGKKVENIKGMVDVQRRRKKIAQASTSSRHIKQLGQASTSVKLLSYLKAMFYQRRRQAEI